MPVKDQASQPPDPKASVEEHRRHFEEFLAKEEHKQKPPKLQDKSDEAKP